jgi:alpha-ketoglutarate-dependent taurine dioxygenase
MNSIITNSSSKDIESNIDDYINLFLENGLLIFPRINLDDEEQLDLMHLFGQKLNWGYIDKSYAEDHLVTFEMTKDDERSANDLFIEWHLEHVERARPQVAASWRMDKFTCSNEFGATGFIDSSALYYRLNDDWQQFLDNCFIKDADSLNPERPCVISHFNNGKKILRLNPHSTKEALFKVGTSEPSSLDIELYKEITQWVSTEIVEKQQDSFWWNWSEGDFILIDLSRMVHAVKGGFSLGQRSFTRHWAYRDKADYKLYTKPMFSKGVNLG